MRLGVFYLTGTGVEINEEKARELFLKTIEFGNPNGYSGLGKISLSHNEIESASHYFKTGHQLGFSYQKKKNKK